MPFEVIYSGAGQTAPAHLQDHAAPTLLGGEMSASDRAWLGEPGERMLFHWPCEACELAPGALRRDGIALYLGTQRVMADRIDAHWASLTTSR